MARKGDLDRPDPKKIDAHSFKIVPFPGNRRPIDPIAVARCGAEVRGFPQNVPLDEFTRDYVIAALWSSTDDSGPLDEKFGIPDIAAPTLQKMAADCADFQREHVDLLQAAHEHYGYHRGKAGRDFWLTRNHHGLGFRDRGLEVIGVKLTEAAHAYDKFELYVGDDELVHGTG